MALFICLVITRLTNIMYIKKNIYQSKVSKAVSFNNFIFYDENTWTSYLWFWSSSSTGRGWTLL